MILDRAMSRLKPEDRLVITLYELEDRSVREVAEMTGWSETRVKVRAIVTETRRDIVEIRKRRERPE